MKIRPLSMRAEIIAICCFLVFVSVCTTGILSYRILYSSLWENLEKKQSESIKVSASVFGAALSGADYKIGENGKLEYFSLAEIPEFDRHELIDHVGKITGETATIFKWDDQTQDFWRKTTNIIKDDGQRAVGTKLGSGNVYDTVKSGRPYYGEATILGKEYLTVYFPIFDAYKRVNGILYAGIKKASFQASLEGLQNDLLTSAAGIIFAAVVIILLFIRQQMKRLERIIDVT